jgi:hypothetical protein
MAKIAKDQLKVKGTLAEYTVTWTYETPVEEWDRKTLLANVRQGLAYAIRRNIVITVLSQEKNLEKNSLKIEKVKAKYADKPIILQEMLDFFNDEGVVTEVQTEFVIRESDYAKEPIDATDDTTGVTEKVNEASPVTA